MSMHNIIMLQLKSTEVRITHDEQCSIMQQQKLNHCMIYSDWYKQELWNDDLKIVESVRLFELRSSTITDTHHFQKSVKLWQSSKYYAIFLKEFTDSESKEKSSVSSASIKCYSEWDISVDYAHVMFLEVLMSAFNDLYFQSIRWTKKDDWTDEISWISVELSEIKLFLNVTWLIQICYLHMNVLKHHNVWHRDECSFSNFDLKLSLTTLLKFFWVNFCDWFLRTESLSDNSSTNQTQDFIDWTSLKNKSSISVSLTCCLDFLLVSCLKSVLAQLSHWKIECCSRSKTLIWASMTLSLQNASIRVWCRWLLQSVEEKWMLWM